jgi:hypothetical protein
LSTRSIITRDKFTVLPIPTQWCHT